MARRSSLTRDPAVAAKQRTIRQREDAVDRCDGRRALEELRRSGKPSFPHAVIATGRPGEIRVWRHNPPNMARVTLSRLVRGQTVEREVGPRGLLSIEEAAAVLRRPAAEVRKDVRAGFLPARRRAGRVVVTVAACHRFLCEEREDGVAALASREHMRQTGARAIPAEQVFRELGLE